MRLTPGHSIESNANLCGKLTKMAGNWTTVKRFLVSEDGPTVTEYAVMLALIIVICLGAISGIGGTVSTVFTNVDAGLPTATAS